MLTADQSAEKIHNAIKGSKLNEQAIMEVCLANKSDHRQEIRAKYNQRYDVELKDDLDNELSSYFRDLVIALFDSPIELDCKQLNIAISFFKRNTDTILEIFSTRPLWMLKMIEQKYEAVYHKNLQSEVEGITSGIERKMLIGLLHCNRDESTSPNTSQCETIANELINGGDKKLTSDEALFNKIFLTLSPTEIVKVGRIYFKKTGKTLLEAIDADYSGNTKKVLTNALYGICEPSELFAMKLREAIKGLGTDTNQINRVLVSRNEVDMKLIRDFYKKKYDVECKQDIVEDTSGNYQNLCLRLLEK